MEGWQKNKGRRCPCPAISAAQYGADPRLCESISQSSDLKITGQHAQNTNGRMAKKQRQAMSLSRYFSCAVWRRPALVRKHIAMFWPGWWYWQDLNQHRRKK